MTTTPQRAGFASATDRGLLITAASAVVSRALIRELAELRDAAAKDPKNSTDPAPSGLTAHAKATLKALRIVAAYRSTSTQQQLPGVARKVVLDYDNQKSFDQFEFNSGGTTELVFIVPPQAANKMAQFKSLLNFCIRSARPSRGTRYIVLCSAMQPSGKTGQTLPAFYASFLEMEKMVQKSGIPFTILRCPFPLQHVITDFVKGGASLNTAKDDPISLKLPIGNGVFSPVASRTVARVAAHLFLTFPNPHMNRILELPGPELLSGVSIASAASRGLGGVPIRYSSCSADEFVKFLIDAGLARTPTHVENMMAVLEMVSQNRFADSNSEKARELLGSWYGIPPKRLAENFEERKEEIMRLLESATPANADTERHGERAQPAPLDPDHPSQRWWLPVPSREIGVTMTAKQWDELYGPQARRKDKSTPARGTYGFVDPKI